MPDTVNDTPPTLTPDDEELLTLVPEETRTRLAARLAEAPDNGPRSPKPDATQGMDRTKHPASGRAAAEAAFEEHFAPRLRSSRR